MRRAEPVLARPALTRPLPLGLPLVVVILGTLLVDRMLGLTGFAVVPQAGFAGGLLPGGSAALLADVVAALVVLVVLLGSHLSRRPRTWGAMAVVLGVASLLGLQLGAATVTATTGVPVATDLHLARAVLFTTVTMAALHLLGELTEHRRVTDALRRETAAAESLAATGRAMLLELRADVARRVREVLRDALAALEVGDASGSGVRLRSLADEVLRPLSHRLAAAPTPTAAVDPVVAVVRWRDTLRALLRTPVVPPRSLAMLAAGLAFLRSLVTDQERVRDLSPAIPIDAEGVGVALTIDVVPLLAVFVELALVFVATRWSAARLASLLVRRRTSFRPIVAWALVSSGLVAIAALTVIGPALVDRIAGVDTGVLDGGAALVSLAASLVPLLAVTVGASLVAAVAADRAALQADLARQRTEAGRLAARVQAVLGHEQRRLARSLHADVQAAVNAAGLMLDRAARDGTVTAQLLDDVAERIALSVERFLGDGASTLRLSERLAEVRALWAGVCVVGIELHPAVAGRIDEDVVARELVVDLITEACANAVVHGGAEEIGVRIGLVGEEVDLDVVDDGTRREPQPRSTRPPSDDDDVRPASDGLGTAVLRASCTRFSLDVGERGTHLHARLPLG